MQLPFPCSTLDHRRALGCAWAAAFLAVISACGSGNGEVEAQPQPGESGPAVGRHPLAEARRLLEAGEATAAHRAATLVGEIPGIEDDLFSARLAAALGDGITALRVLGEASGQSTQDARIHGARAEVYIALGRNAAAADEIRAGLALGRPSPELMRARAMLLLATPGGGCGAIDHLLEARALDPGLPFCDRALSQAHLLCGRKALGEDDPAKALRHARAGAAAWEDLDLLELEADACSGLGAFEQALRAYARLEASGRNLGDTRAILHHRAATRALVEGDRERALQHYLAARNLGMDAAGLGFGQNVLREAAEAQLDGAIEMGRGGNLEGAHKGILLALDLDPAHSEALEHLGAASLGLARQRRDQGKPGEARALLLDFLARAPEGPWSDDARRFLAGLD